MSGSVRLLWRVAALAATTLGLYAVRLLSLPFTIAFAQTDRRVRQALLRTWARTCARIYGMRIRTIGTPPKPPFFLVTNHLTYLDAVTLASQIDVIFVAKSEVSDWPAVGFFSKQVNVIFVDRKKRSDTLRVNDSIESTIRSGESVVMFPESTTSRGDDVQPFKTALFQPAAQYGFPVHYAAIHYAALPGSPPATEWITWWTEISFGGHISRVLRQPGMNVTLTFCDAPITGNDRKVLAEQAHDGVQALFAPCE